MTAASTPARIDFVIITRNESANIAACLTSIASVGSDAVASIVVVDSASTDGTQEIAARHPVTIVQLPSDVLLSPSAGRYIGTGYGTAPFVQFLDGDMMLMPGWLEAAHAVMADPRVGGVAGRLYWVKPGEALNLTHPDQHPSGEVESFGGTALYRREALTKAGTFNPFMLGEEERELGYRLTKAGYRLIKLESAMAYHLEKERTAEEVDEKARYFQGVGQLLRGYPFQSICWRILRAQRREGTRLATFWGLPVTATLSALFGFPVPALMLIALFVLAALLVISRKGMRKTYLYARARVLIPWNILRGFLRGIHAADLYMPRVSVIRGHAPSGR